MTILTVVRTSSRASWSRRWSRNHRSRLMSSNRAGSRRCRPPSTRASRTFEVRESSRLRSSLSGVPGISCTSPSRTAWPSVGGTSPRGAMPREVSTRHAAPARYRARGPALNTTPGSTTVVAARPPGRRESRTATRAPARAATAAAVNPASPAPTTTTSTSPGGCPPVGSAGWLPFVGVAPGSGGAMLRSGRAMSTTSCGEALRSRGPLDRRQARPNCDIPVRDYPRGAASTASSPKNSRAAGSKSGPRRRWWPPSTLSEVPVTQLDSGPSR